MGNTTSRNSHHRHDHHQHIKQQQPRNPEVVNAFNELRSGNDVITFDEFKAKFGAFLSPYLWRYLQEDPNATAMTLEQFSRHALSLTGMSTDVYIKILGSAKALLHAAFEAAKISTTERDNAFLDLLTADMVRKGDNVDELIKWKNMVCPRLCHAIQNRVLDKFFHRKRDVGIVNSDILTQAEMFILINSLPVTIYSPQRISEENVDGSKLWTKLYSSSNQGISINRFETNVFKYRGSTVIIFQMTDNRVFAIACDEEWRHSLNKFGGPNTFLWQFRPSFQHYELPEKPVFCNFKMRSVTFGLHVGRHFSVDGEMSDVSDIEAWGCAGDSVLEEQHKMKLRAKQQVERNAKVPLPGAWDDNPDKSIMEMAGFQFSNERKHDRPD